MAKKGE